MNIFGLFLVATLFKPVSTAACTGGWTAVDNNAKIYISTDETNSNRLFLANNDDYKVTCDCGVISSWKFYARRAGTLYVFMARLDGSQYKVVNVNKITIPPLSGDNYFEVPIAAGYRMSVKQNDYIGWFTTTAEMITYDVDATADSVGYLDGVSSVAKGDLLTISSSFTDRRFAISAYVYQNRAPMFLNAPYSVTMYTDSTVSDVITLSVFDHDPDDESRPLDITDATATGFAYDPSTKKLTYNTPQGEGTHVSNFTVTDTCVASPVSATVTVKLINRETLFTNLPAWTSLDEGTAAPNFFSITTSDSGDTVTCSIQSQTASGISINANALSFDGRAFSSNKWHSLRLRCNDETQDVDSAYTVDVTQNTKPVFTNLPGSVVVNPSSSSVVLTVGATDTDSLTYSITTVGVPFTIVAGAITPTPPLTAAGYDLTISVTDGTNTVTSTLSVLNSGTPRQNTAPVITNLPATKNVLENTAVGTYLFTVGYKDADQSDTLTLTHTFSDADMGTYFNVDDATGIVTVKALIDFESLAFSASSDYIRFTISDGTDSNTGDLTFVIENVNESPSFSAATYTASVNEGPADTQFSDPGISTTDTDTPSTPHTIKMSCGTNSKDFYIITTAGVTQIKLARAWDADVTGITNSATCTLTVTDEGGLTATASLSLTITNINDHNPAFRYQFFTFVVSASSSFFTTIGNISATDDDSDTYGTTNGVVTYSFLDSGDTYFMADETGTLFVRDVSSFSTGSFTNFRFVATDAGGLTGTCTVTIIFSDVQATTVSPTMERTFTMLEDADNYVWMVILGVILLACFILSCAILCRDPAFRETLAEWNRRRRIREPTLDKATREMKEYLEQKRARKEEKARLKEEKRQEKLRKKDPSYGLPWELLATKTTQDVIEDEEDEDGNGKKKKKKKKKDKKEEKRKEEKKRVEEKKKKTPLVVQASVEATPTRSRGRGVPSLAEENTDQVIDEILEEEETNDNAAAPMFGTGTYENKRAAQPKKNGVMDF